MRTLRASEPQASEGFSAAQAHAWGTSEKPLYEAVLGYISNGATIHPAVTSFEMA